MLRSIANIMKISGCDIPEWMLQLKKINKNERRHLAKHAIKRDDITTQAKFDRKRRDISRSGSTVSEIEKEEPKRVQRHP